MIGILMATSVGGAATGTSSRPVTAASTNSLGPQGDADASAAGTAQVNRLFGIDSTGALWSYAANGAGGYEGRIESGYGWSTAQHLAQVDHNADNSADGHWDVTAGTLTYTAWGDAAEPITVGTGWGIYDKFLSAGNLGGAPADDLIARDSSGTLWIYLGYGDGKLTQRRAIGGGWNVYDQIAGKGDLSGDGKDDIVARDTAGVLWLYQGTGDYTAPFTPRTRIGSGWNIFNLLVSVGDVDLDGTADLITRDTGGGLWRYSGTRQAAAPYAARVQIGTGWNIYRLVF
ncbi:FG-GAP repeat domain-containing protein [Streptomyces exfoliatus]|uniref:FG-GAP repeat domain-containing protein n=1 Tax=Streptomyces exfoliatus TaxID=1905 RepID=UPI0006899BB4|nr:VCBS repeat-containing protein [Streptomyces exfoliatus]